MGKLALMPNNIKTLPLKAVESELKQDAKIFAMTINTTAHNC